MSTKPNFIIFSPTGEKPHVTLASIQTKPDENGIVENQVNNRGSQQRIVSCFFCYYRRFTQ